MFTVVCVDIGSWSPIVHSLILQMRKVEAESGVMSLMSLTRQ